MSFDWHGRGNPDGKVWEREIKRYQFTSGEAVILPSQFGERHVVSVGSSWKISKAEAHRWFQHGYIEVRTHCWNTTKGRIEPVDIRITNGKVHLDIEKSVLTEHEVTPESVAPKRKGK